MNALLEHELEEIDSMEFTEEAKERFKIEDLDQLNWVFRKLRALNAEEKEVKDLAEAERFRIDEWEKSKLTPIQQSKEFFISLIHEYHAEQLKENPKAKTLSTPYGKSKSRTTKEQPDKLDEDKLLAHVKESGQTEYIKESIKWGDYKKSLKVAEIDGQKVVVDELGQVVPGATVKPETITFSVDVE